jgi:serine/threonine protein kinase
VIGQQIGNYKVLSLLGAGGMGEVYLAEHATIGTRVAIKILMAGISKDQDQVNRFFNEARAVNKVRHAGPVKIFDVGFHTDSVAAKHAYLVMEYLEGESLAGRIKRMGTLPGEMVADIGRQIAGVLDAVHSAGITHRDLKPDNIFLVPDHELPSGERVKVLDFGIAKLTGTMAGPQTKGTMGTPAYMAPEQWNNAGAVDGRADTYSLGCVMFEMAVGQPPFPAGSIGEACNHHLNSKPPRASAMVPTVPVEFDALLDKMLAKTVDMRPTVREVVREVDMLRQSGATSRWTASSMQAVGVAQTMAPSGSQPYIPPGSQPNMGSHPGSYGHGSQPPGSPPPGSQPPGYIGHVPGMHNPLATPVHGQPPVSQSYPAQSSPAIYPPQPTPQHTTPIHHTPQHQTPSPYAPQHHTPPPYTPQHLTPHHQTQPPTGGKSNKGLLIGLGALVAVGGGVAVVLAMQSGGSDKPGPGSDKGSDKGSSVLAGPGSDKTPGPGSDKTPGSGSDKTPPQPPAPSKREQVLAKNPFADVHGVKLLSTQISGKEYELVIGKSPVPFTDPAAPLHSLTQTEAAAFCTAIGMRLPTTDEWTQAAKGAWCIAVGADCGPLQEWTSTVKDELAVVRGGHDKMTAAQRDKAALSKPPYFLQKEVSTEANPDRKVASGPTIGFRCVDDPNAKAAAAAPAPGGSVAGLIPAKPDTKPDAPAPPAAAGLPQKLTRSWLSSVDKSGGGQKITQVTSMQLTATGAAVTGQMIEVLTVDGKKYTNGLAVTGKISGSAIEIATTINRKQEIPAGMTYCTLKGKLALDDSKPKLKLTGTLVYGAPCTSNENESYTFYANDAAAAAPPRPRPAGPGTSDPWSQGHK